MATGQNKKTPVASLATVNDYRLPAWPVGKPSEPIDTPWGSVSFPMRAPTGRHRDIIDAIAACALATVVDAVGRLHVLFDAAEVSAMLTKSADWHWLHAKLIELTTIAITLKRPEDDWGQVRTILAGANDTDIDAPRKGSRYGAKLKQIIFSEITTQMLATDLIVNVQKEVVIAILGLRHQVSRNLARWCLSHETDQHHQSDTVLNACGCGGGERMTRKYLSQIKADAEGLKKLGIELADKKIHYSRHKGVWFRNQKAEPISAGTDDERNQYQQESEPISAGNSGFRNQYQPGLRDI